MRTEQTRLIRCLLYGFVDYSEKRTKLFDILTSDQGLKVRTATYGPEIDQSQHAKSISHIIKPVITRLKKLWCSFQSKAVHTQEKKDSKKDSWQFYCFTLRSSVLVQSGGKGAFQVRLHFQQSLYETDYLPVATVFEGTH